MGKWRIKQVANVDGDSVVIQSGGSIRSTGRGSNNVVQSDKDGVFVNGEKVADSADTIHFGNGGVWIDGKRIS